MTDAARSLLDAFHAFERQFSEELHPRVPAGSAGGGQFGSKSQQSQQPAKKTQPSKAQSQATTPKKKGPRGPKVVIPKGAMGYDPSTNHGTGYGVKGGDKGVHSLQRLLNRLGFTDLKGRRLADDGRLGPLTTSALKKAQRALGVTADGIATPALLKKLAAMKPRRRPRKTKTATAGRVAQILADLGFERKFNPDQPRDPDGKWGDGVVGAVKAIADLFGNPAVHHAEFGKGGFVAEHEDGAFTIGKPGGGLAVFISDDSDLDDLSFALDSASDGIRNGESGSEEGGGWRLNWGPDGAVLHGEDESQEPTQTHLSADDVDSLASAVESVRQGGDPADGQASDLDLGGGDLPPRYADLDDVVAEDLADVLEGVSIAPAEDSAPGELLYSDDDVAVTELADGGVRLEWSDGTTDELDREQAGALSDLLRGPHDNDT